MAENELRTGTPRVSAATRAVLYVSLALNLVVVGLLISGLVFGGVNEDRRGPPRGAETGLGPVMRAFQPEDRKRLGEEMRRTLRQERRTRAETAQITADLAGAFTADPFEIEAVQAILDDQFGEAEFRLQLAKTLLVERIAKMTVAERAELAERIVSPARRQNSQRNGN